MNQLPKNNFWLNRRHLLKYLGLGCVSAPFIGGLPNYLPFLNRSAQAADGVPHRFLQIFLEGGWDSTLAIDPCIGAKIGAGYQNSYHGNGTAAVAGKPNLILGPGLLPAANAFAQAPTAFVNGIFVEVTAHELAVNYLYSGRLSLSRSREYPAIIATMADTAGGFPAHVILGGIVPLGETAKTNPPLQSPSTGTFAQMLTGPYEKDENGAGAKGTTIDAAHELTKVLDGSFHKRLRKNAIDSLATWTKARDSLGALYAKQYGDKLKFSDQLKTDFGIGTEEDSGRAKLAMAYNVLKAGVSRFVTVTIGGFDTHQAHMERHLPIMEDFATGLNVLIGYLAATNDPDSPANKLIETTTILITSEFVRTPLFNGANGTDHWQSGSAIVMGKKVKDNIVVGSTDEAGNAVDFGAGKLLPDHLAASLLRTLGFTTQADLISGVQLNDIFG